jgi:hypothetical protein
LQDGNALTADQRQSVAGNAMAEHRWHHHGPRQRLINAMMPPPANLLAPYAAIPACPSCGRPASEPTLAHYLQRSEYFDATLRSL